MYFSESTRSSCPLAFKLDNLYMKTPRPAGLHMHYCLFLPSFPRSPPIPFVSLHSMSLVPRPVPRRLPVRLHRQVTFLIPPCLCRLADRSFDKGSVVLNGSILKSKLDSQLPPSGGRLNAIEAPCLPFSGGASTRARRPRGHTPLGPRD